MRPVFTLAALAALTLSSAVHAYTFTGSRWTTSTVTMHLQLGTSSTPLTDGSPSWNAVAENALATWNSHINATRFTVVRESTATRAQGNRLNNIFFSSSVYGEAWGSGVLAVTLTYTSGGFQTTETDVLFNNNLGWDSYRGGQRYGAFDLHRVALHEFGHALGLDHPDQDGQTVIALMNSRISSLDTVASDDIAGAQALYGVNSSLSTPPTFTMQPASQTAMPGDSVTFRVAVTSGTPVSYQWFKNGLEIAGGTAATLTLASVTTTAAGTYAVTAANGAGLATSNPAVLTVNSPPVVMAGPTAQTVSAGERVILTVTASGSPAPQIQWRKDGVAIAGAIQPEFVIDAAAPEHAGTYTAVLTNVAGSVTTTPVVVTVNFSQLVNLSTRGFIPAGGALTAGFVLRGAAEKQVILRGIGPALQTYGIGDALADPRLALVAQQSGATIASNDSWSQVSNLSTAFQGVGAFPLPSGSADAATQVRLAPGSYTTRVSATSTSMSGVALAEVYDSEASSLSTRLVNLSTLGYSGAGDRALVAGFSIKGNTSKRVLIRAVGPGLAPYNVAGALSNPRLDVYVLGGSTAIAGNDNWSGTAELRAAFTATGAFPLEGTSADAAVLLLLPPGGYTVVVTGANNTTGHVLTEIYDLDP